jgi:hypothetical protein
MFALDHALEVTHVCPTSTSWPTRLVFSPIFFFQNGNKANSLVYPLKITVIIIIIISLYRALSVIGYLAVDGHVSKQELKGTELN